MFSFPVNLSIRSLPFVIKCNPHPDIRRDSHRQTRSLRGSLPRGLRTLPNQALLEWIAGYVPLGPTHVAGLHLDKFLDRKIISLTLTLSVSLFLHTANFASRRGDPLCAERGRGGSSSTQNVFLLSLTVPILSHCVPHPRRRHRCAQVMLSLIDCSFNRSAYNQVRFALFWQITNCRGPS